MPRQNARDEHETTYQPMPVDGCGMSAFDEVTTTIAEGQGRYSATLDSTWAGPFGPNGGYVAAILLRAALTELARPELPPRTLTVHYLRAADGGPVELHANVLRSGRHNATLQAGVAQHGRLVSTALITCSAPRPQALTLSLPAPDAPRPEELDELSPEVFDGAPAFLRRLRLRPCFGSPILGGAEAAVTGGWIEFRDDEQPLDALRLTALTDLWWPAVFSAAREPVGVPTLELTVHLRSTAKHAGPVLARFETSTVSEGHLEESGRLFSTSGELLAESRQLALLASPPA